MRQSRLPYSTQVDHLRYMLESVKNIIAELPDIPFWEYYQNYICEVQDLNIKAEIENLKTDEITSITKLISRLNAAR